jgi:hypothetical protein
MNYKKIWEYSKKFEEIEVRDVFYKIATRLISKSSDLDDRVDAILVVLLTWNRGFYRYRTFDTNHVEEFSNAMREFETIFDLLRRKNLDLDNINFESEIFQNLSSSFADDVPSYKEAILLTFDRFSEILGWTGASKAMHLINARLFMMWDDAIRKNYRCPCSPEGYIEFMKSSQDTAKEIITSYCKEFNCSRGEALESISSLADGKTLPKLIDEYNYVRFTKGLIL